MRNLGVRLKLLAIRVESLEFCSTKSYTNIEFSERIGSAEVRAFELSCDIQVVLLNKTNIQIPGKLYQCLADKPCVVICQISPSREILRLIKASPRAVICSNNVESIKRALVNLGEERVRRIGSYLRVFNWEVLAQRVDRKLAKLI